MENGIYDLMLFFRNFQFIKNTNNSTLNNRVIIIPQKHILSLFSVDIKNHYKARLAIHLHLQGFSPSEIDKLYYWEFEEYLILLNEYLKEKNDQERKSYDDQRSSMPDYSKQQKNMGKQMKQPKLPKMPKF